MLSILEIFGQQSKGSGPKSGILILIFSMFSGRFE
jgi:hypothetical protein